MATSWNGWGQNLQARKIRAWIAGNSTHIESVEIDYEYYSVTVRIVGDTYTFSSANLVALVRMYRYAVRCMVFAERSDPNV